MTAQTKRKTDAPGREKEPRAAAKSKDKGGKPGHTAAEVDDAYRKVKVATEPGVPRKETAPPTDHPPAETGPRKEAKPGKEGEPKEAGANRIRKLESRLVELEDKYLRLRAEYDNHIRRTQREKQELLVYSAADILRRILPVLDDFRRTLGAADETHKLPDDDPFVQGVAMIYAKLLRVLESEGVHPFESVGRAFDPELHEAMMTRPSEDHPGGYVIEEFEPGFKYRDRVLRHAKVIVSE